MKTERLCFALDLKNDSKLIQKYIAHHQNVWPEIIASIKESGIVSMEIYNISNRLFMIIDVNESFSIKAKTKKDKDNPKVQEWETLMETFQQKLPGTANGEKWIQMNKIFEL